MQCLRIVRTTSLRSFSASAHPLVAPSLHGKSFRLAIVGAGPAGFYAASKLLSFDGSDSVRVDMFEQLPVPFGLVRFGVAPDHPEVKNCEHKFEQTAEDSRFRFFGNVQIGAPDSPDAASSEVNSIPLQVLRDHYDAVLLTYGAAHDRPLGIPGEDALGNIFSAREFVHFYNGHPKSSIHDLDLSRVEHVTVIGQGNVAFDCARLLLAPIDELAKTDISERMLAELARSRVRRVDVVGRRGPLQVAGTTKELRELLHLPGVAFEIDPLLVAQAETVLATRPKERARKRLHALMKEGAKSPSDAKSWSLGFLRSPVAFLPASGETTRVGKVEWAVNELVGEDPLTARARPTGEMAETATDLVLKSVGYRSIGIPGLPFDERAGVVRNQDGRVVDEQGIVVDGLYTSGWLARGPTGVIATTMFDAYLTAEIIAQDATARSDDTTKPTLNPATGCSQPLVDWTAWRRIDEEERRRGAAKGKPREKFTNIRDMLDFISR